MSRTSIFWSEIAFLVPVLLIGCGKQEGPELAHVTGTITLDGHPLPRVNLRFIPELPGGSPSFGGTNVKGQYKLLFNAHRTGAMIGKHQVELEAANIATDEEGNPLPGAQVTLIPKEYTQPGALTAEIKAGSNTVNFALETKKMVSSRNLR